MAAFTVNIFRVSRSDHETRGLDLVARYTFKLHRARAKMLSANKRLESRASSQSWLGAKTVARATFFQKQFLHLRVEWDTQTTKMYTLLQKLFFKSALVAVNWNRKKKKKNYVRDTSCYRTRYYLSRYRINIDKHDTIR